MEATLFRPIRRSIPQCSPESSPSPFLLRSAPSADKSSIESLLMSHLSLEDLKEYAESTQHAPSADVDAHLRQCPQCHSLLAEIRELLLLDAELHRRQAAHQ
jgi:hypothetical protein